MYKDYSRNDISIGKDLKQIMQKYIKNGFFGRNILEGKLLNYKVVSEDPSQIFEIPALIKAGITMVFYAKSYLPDGKPEGRIIHLARDTNYGCEMRSRFWLYNAPEESAQIRLEHYISEHGYLADSLKKFIEEYLKLSHNRVVNCKFCASNNVIKNGSRAGTQYWRCKECGRGFVDNTCLPKMKYSFNIVGKAVYDYCNGKSISDIRKDINKKYKLFPSDSTILGWIRKLTKATYNDYKINTELKSDMADKIVATSSQIESHKDIC
jgi:transposase-like protein